jgi:ABC-2 type transport system permease protein
MTATTFVTTPAPLVPATKTAEAVLIATIVNTFKAEWTKLRTLRSTWYTVGGAGLISVVLAAIICAAQVSQWDSMSAKQHSAFDPTSTALIGVLFATVIFGTLAVRAMTSEYSTGMIRVTFSAVPRRGGVVVAKAVILAVLAFPVALVSNVVAFLVCQQILAGKVGGMSLGQPGVARAVIFGALAVSLVAVIGVSLGGIIRRTAGATTALSVGIIGSQILGIALPAAARQLLPGTVIQSLVTVQHTSGLLAPTTALAVLAAYAVAAFWIASALIARRDA